MKEIIQHETYGEILYEEHFWTGKKSLLIDGVPLEKISKKEFKFQDGSFVTVSGNFLCGAIANINGETIRLTDRVKWYEIALCILPLILNLIWGNVVALCKIVPVVGGALGGGISGALSIIGLLGIKSVKPIWLKIIIALLILGVSFGICAGIGYAIVSALT